jgi:2-haloacid dehalogenase
MALERVKALVFDVFGTVVDWRGGVIRDAGPFLARHGGAAADAERFADAWRGRYNPAMEEVRSGRRPFTRLEQLHREELERILPDFGVDPRGVPEADLKAFNQAWHRLDPWPDVVAGLTRLKRGFVIAPLSNGNIALLLNMAKHGGLPWDAILGAEIVQAYKPQPEVYLRTAEILDLEPAEVCLVAAHNSDLAAARRCGLRTAYVIRPLESGGPPRPIPPNQDWDVVCDDFGGLADQLGL